jgi:hypothetical protein
MMDGGAVGSSTQNNTDDDSTAMIIGHSSLIRFPKLNGPLMTTCYKEINLSSSTHSGPVR